MWTYYDFDRHWTRFFEAWNAPHIQDILFRDLMDFDIYSGIMYPWQRGDPVWFLTSSNYWDRRAEIKIQERHMMQKYKKSFSNATGYRFVSNQDLYTKFYKFVYPKIQYDLFPKPNTLESLVLIGGNEAISSAMYNIALSLCNNSEVVSVYDEEEEHRWILMPQQKIVFDIEGYYMYNKSRDPRYSLASFNSLLDHLTIWNIDSDSNDSIS